MGAGEPQIPIIAGKTARITVHELVDHDDGVLSPIHKACLDILQRLCQIRQAQNEASASEEPKTLDAFCDALRRRRWRNFIEPDKSTSEVYYYAKSGGIEWLHNYYGARQFWTDEWDTEPGWELSCGDPSRLTIPGLTPYLLSEFPRLPSPTTAQKVSKDQVADRLGWLFPEEIDAIIGNDTGCGDWEQGIEALVQKANMMSADEGGVEEGNKEIASASLGLKNRWRIWEILQGFEFRQDI